MTSESQRILFVFTSVSQSLQGDQTGWYLPEAAYPYNELSPHFTIDFAAPAGPNPTMDPVSGKHYGDDDNCRRFLKDTKVQSLLENAKRLRDVSSDDYCAIFYIGGRGAVIDLPEYEPNIELAKKFYSSGKLVGAICQGQAALAFVPRPDGASIFNGKTATGFSDDEDHQVGRLEGIPFSVEKRIKLLGATYVKSGKPWEPKVVCSGNLLTGQNPASAKQFGEDMKKALQKSNA